MGKEINLLPKKNISFLQRERTILLLRLAALVSVVIVVSVGIGIFLLGRTYSVDSVASQQEAMQSKLRVLLPKIQREIATADRITKIQGILKTRPSIGNKVSQLQALIPADVSLDQLTMTTKTFTLSLSSHSLSSLTTCLDGFANMLKEKKFFTTLTINNVTVDAKAGLYKVNVQGTLL